MYKIVTLLVALAVAGCSGNSGVELPWFSASANAAATPALLAPPPPPAATPIREEEFRAAYCELAKKGHGLPIWLDPAMKAKAVEKLGREDTAKLLRPVARTNNAVRCFCASGVDRVKLKCK